jgi:Na+/H+-translocating membrane pyrophosphatase
MNEPAPAIASLSDEALQALLKSAIYKILILGVLASLVLWVASGWGTGALFASGALVSAASIFEWRRLVRIINSRMRNQAAPRGIGLSIAFILLRLVVFGGVIYGSLKCFRGSPLALVCGLSLAVITLTWEALKLLRG